MSQTQLSDPRGKLLTLMGLSEEEQSPDYYRLLGLESFEEDPEVIKTQVERRTRMLTMHKTGPYLEASRELLYAVNSAKTCLLTPRLKDIYDRKLRADHVKRNGRPGPSAKKSAANRNPADADVAGHPNGKNGARKPASDPFDDSDDDDLFAIESLFGSSEPSKGAVDSSSGEERDDLDLVLDGDIDFLDHSDEPKSDGQAKTKQAAAPNSGDSPPASNKAVDASAAAVRKDVQATASKSSRKSDAATSNGQKIAASVDDSRPAQPAEAWIPDDAGYELVSPAVSERTGSLDDVLLQDDVDDDETDDSFVDDEIVDQDADEEELPDTTGTGLRRWSGKRLAVVGAGIVALLAVGFLYMSGLFRSDDPSWATPVPRSAIAKNGPRDPVGRMPANPAHPVAPSDDAEPSASPTAGPAVEIGIACSEEKRFWLETAVEEFAHTESGRRIRVELIPAESLEGARAIVRGDERINVWTPASRAYRGMFLGEWQKRHGSEPGFVADPIVRDEVLALSPMVIVMWKSRYEAFVSKSPEVSLKTIGYAMHADSGWDGIAGKPEWGRFKFHHTHPAKSNSGLMTLAILAYDFYGKTSGLTVDDVDSSEFQQYMSWFGGWVAGVSNSTDDLMKDMILKGPSVHDAAMVYESTAIAYFEMANGRWEPLVAVYPEQNLWNDNPYYILDTPWSTPSEQEAAAVFLEFLLSDSIQRKALEHGFRPGNLAVPVKGADSPFVRYSQNGLRVELPEACHLPGRKVLEDLQQEWMRNASPR